MSLETQIHHPMLSSIIRDIVNAFIEGDREKIRRAVHALAGITPDIYTQHNGKIILVSDYLKSMMEQAEKDYAEKMQRAKRDYEKQEVERAYDQMLWSIFQNALSVLWRTGVFGKIERFMVMW